MFCYNNFIFISEYLEEMRADVEILACGSIKNLTAFKIPDTDENWCCLVSLYDKNLVVKRDFITTDLAPINNVKSGLGCRRLVRKPTITSNL